MDESLRQFIRERANGVCEYCRFPEEHAFNPFQVDHVIAEKHGGPTIESNLAWSCYYCNTFKGPNIAGWIADESAVVRLYHPRSDPWSDHFVWQDAILAEKTQIGRVTLDVLRINHPDAIAVRRALIEYRT
jgi:HNH endonuclease